MALKPCRECGRQVSTEALSCPQCGVPNPTVEPAVPVQATPAPELGEPIEPIALKKPSHVGEYIAGSSVLAVLAFIAVAIGSQSGGSQNSGAMQQASRVTPVQLDQRAAEQKRLAEAAEKSRKEAECRSDLRCWAEKGTVAASVYCRDQVEKLANYSMKWTDAWYESKFSRYRWSRKDQGGRGIVTYLGDKAQFQNGFGAFQNVIYTCDMIPEDKDHTIYDVSVAPGRLN